jgi:hypothetical protein
MGLNSISFANQTDGENNNNPIGPSMSLPFDPKLLGKFKHLLPGGFTKVYLYDVTIY